MKRILIVLTILTGLSLVARAEDAAVDNYQKMIAYKFGESRLALTAIENEVRAAKPAAYGPIEDKLLAALQNAQATPDAKDFVCRQLRIVGSCKCVPVVATLLADEKLSHMGRYAMEGMACPKVDDVLRETLGKVSGKLKIGMISSIGARGDRKAVPDLAKLVSDSDATLAGAAIAALGRIGGDKATAALATAKVADSLKAARADAYLKCADQMLAGGDAKGADKIYREMFAEANPVPMRVASLRGIVLAEKEKSVPTIVAMLKSDQADLQRTAGKLVADIPGPAATKAVVTELAALPANIQVLVLNGLSVRGDKAAAAGVAGLAGSADESVRIAAFEALGVLGDASVVDVLVKNIKTPGATGQAAQNSLRRIRGDGINEVVAKALKDPDAGVRASVVGILASRQYTAAVPTLKDLTNDADGAVRSESWKALGTLAGAKELPSLVTLLVKAQAGDQGNAEQAVQNVASRISDADQRAQPLLAAMTGADAGQRSSLLRVLGRVGGAKALGAVNAAVSDADAGVQDTAVHALADWTDDGAAGALLALAKNDKAKPDHRILALRGYVRVVGLPSKRSPEETVKMLNEAMKAATRSDEKRQVLGVLTGLAHPSALAAVEAAMADEAVRGEAEAAFMKICEAMKDKHRSEVKSALQRFIESTKNEALKSQATKLLGSIGA